MVVSWSGGKDSSLALQHVLVDQQFEVAGLLTAVTRDYDRISVHGVRTTLLRAQCDALNQRLMQFEIPAQCSNAVYETALMRELLQLRDAGIRDVVFGDLFLEDIRRYREGVLAQIGMQAHFPLWNRDTKSLAHGFLADGFRALLVCVDRARLAPAFCGREFDTQLLDELPPECDPCGERGEFHTFVYDGPMFKKPLRVARGETVERGNAVYTDVVLHT